MNRNHLIGFSVTAAVLGLLAFAAWYFLEIHPDTKTIPPSREARVNEYLALDRWLGSEGISVRTESSGDLPMISRAREKQIFIQASLFRWTGEAVEYLVRWVEDGGNLFLAMDYSREWDEEEPYLLLERFGIETESPGYNSAPDRWSGACPDFDYRVSFGLSEEGEALTLIGRDGVTRLVQLTRGKGKLIVTGRPRFLLSENLGDAPNARLAWALFAADGEEGWLFIRGTAKVRGLFGSLWRQGNLAVLVVSVIVLLVIGFWTVIPMFGLVRGDDEKPGKALRERFLAEGRFLKSYGALEIYRGNYVREIRRRLARREGVSADAETEKRVLEIMKKTEHASGTADRIASRDTERDFIVDVLRGEPVTYRDFPKAIKILMTILERI